MEFLAKWLTATLNPFFFRGNKHSPIDPWIWISTHFSARVEIALLMPRRSGFGDTRSRWRTPAASQVRITALALWAMATPSRTTRRSGWRSARRRLTLSILWGVGIAQNIEDRSQ